jgi:hypothetical protein
MEGQLLSFGLFGSPSAGLSHASFEGLSTHVLAAMWDSQGC